MPIDPASRLRFRSFGLRDDAAGAVDVWKLASLLGLLVLLVAALLSANAAGITIDEQREVGYHDRILSWFSSGFQDRRATKYLNLHFYGGLFGLPAQWLAQHSPLGIYETRHLLSALTALLGVVFTWQLATRLAGPRAGFLSALLLVATPAWTGHGLFNPKDIPFGTAVAFVTYACVRIALAQGPLSWADAARAGLALGAALGVRSGGMFLIAYLLLAAFGGFACDMIAAARRGDRLWDADRTRALATTGMKVSAAGLLAWLIMISTWPWAQLAPFTRPFMAAAMAQHFPWSRKVLFDGQLIPATQLPAAYLPTWLVITLPETYALALAAGIVVVVLAWRTSKPDARQWLAGSLLALSLVAPLCAVLIKRPVIYDAYRHFLFVLPPLAAIAGISLSSFFASAQIPKLMRTLTGALFVGLLALTFEDMRELHPYEYTYFNRAFGGLKAAAGRFETDYWGASYKEGLSWVISHPNPRSTTPTRIAWCNHLVPLDYYMQAWGVDATAFTLVPKRRQADIYLGITRDMCPRPAGKIIHAVKRQGVMLLYVVKLRGPAPEPSTPSAGAELPATDG